MQLVVKLYSDKPSRIAVKFVYEYQAVREYETLLRKFQSDNCRISFEIVNHKVVLTLVSDENGEKQIYKDLEFRVDQLQRLFAYFSKESPMLFVHIYPRSNTLFVAKPFRKENFLKVTDIQLVGSLQSGF